MASFSSRSGRMLLVGPIAVIGCLLLAEGGARLFTRGSKQANPYYVEISSDFAELDALIEDMENLPPPKYYDEFLYAEGPFSSTYVNFTDYYSARLTPDSAPLEVAEYIFWTFGGSTMENIETTDELTIANTWARFFNESLGPAHVKNFGTAGFLSSYELIKFQKLLREVPERERPDVAIFYDGYNDARYGFQYGPGSLQKDLSLKEQALVENDHFRTGMYAISRGLAEHSVLWDRTAARFVAFWLFPLPEPDTDSANLDGAVHIYVTNVSMILATCQAFDVQCFFVLQPLLLTKEPLSRVEQDVLHELNAHPRFGPEGVRFVRDYYQRVTQELADNNRFIDASAILNGRSEADFYDLGHVSALSPPIIGEAIATLILARMEETNR